MSASPSSAPVRVQKVVTRADFKPFFDFPWRVYKDDPNWTPPLLSMRRDTFDKEKGPAWEYLTGDYFTAWRGDQIVGTIAAYINHRHNEFHNEQIGWFGAFECYEDQEAATALLTTAIEWVKAQGFSTIRGPQTFTTHEEAGLLVDGFVRPVLLTPYNPPYYARLVETVGFRKVADMYNFYNDRTKVNESGLFPRLERITASVMKRNRLTIRPINRAELHEEFVLFKDLYNAGWEKNWGFVPMTPRELDGLVEALGQFFDPALAFFGYVDDQPAGFIMGVPDFNQVLHKAYARPGKPEVISLLQSLYYWKLRPVIDWARIPLMGVKAEYRGKGVDAAMYYYLLRKMLQDKRYNYADSGWILESNTNMVNIAKNFGSEIYKTFRIYEREI